MPSRSLSAASRRNNSRNCAESIRSSRSIGTLIETSHYPHVGPPAAAVGAGRGAQRAAQPLQCVARLNA